VNTLGGRLGAEYRVSERFAARLGVLYRPTMIPLQNVAGTNLLDANTVGLSTGIGFNFSDPLEIFEHPIQIDFAAQAAFLLQREAVKPATDVLPSYTYAARVFGGTAMIRYDF
jgi:long-subunit fatty acid transport protein